MTGKMRLRTNRFIWSGSSLKLRSERMKKGSRENLERIGVAKGGDVVVVQTMNA